MVTTKVGYHKLPLNVPFVLTNGILIHSKECVFKWKYIMKHRITDESVIYDQHHSCAAIIEMIEKVGMMCTINNLGMFYPKFV